MVCKAYCLKIICVVVLIFLQINLIACGNSENFAPVTDLNLPSHSTKNTITKKVSFAATRNLSINNQIKLLPPISIARQKIIIDDRSNTALFKKNKLLPRQIETWLWPLKGKIASSFSRNQKGINILGKPGDPVIASADGQVIYCGNGLKGYGNLIILKHNESYLSTYAYNKTIYVKQGDWIKQGQKIAEVGNSEKQKNILHFEIRKLGIPVNPLILLNAD